jgi:hypothetical protein
MKIILSNDCQTLPFVADDASSMSAMQIEKRPVTAGAVSAETAGAMAEGAAGGAAGVAAAAEMAVASAAETAAAESAAATAAAVDALAELRERWTAALPRGARAKLEHALAGRILRTCTRPMLHRRSESTRLYYPHAPIPVRVLVLNNKHSTDVASTKRVHAPACNSNTCSDPSASACCQCPCCLASAATPAAEWRLLVGRCMLTPY